MIALVSIGVVLCTAVFGVQLWRRSTIDAWGARHVSPGAVVGATVSTALVAVAIALAALSLAAIILIAGVTLVGLVGRVAARI